MPTHPSDAQGSGSSGQELHQGALAASRHALRRRILRDLIEDDRPISPSELAIRLRRPLSEVSYHVRALAKYGAINLVSTVPVRGSVKHFYRIDDDFRAIPFLPAILEL